VRRSLDFIEPILGVSHREGSRACAASQLRDGPLNLAGLVAIGGGIELPSAMRLDESLPIPTGERLAWERMLNRHLNACGCAEGSVGLLIGVAVVLAAYLVSSEPWSTWAVGAACALPLALLAGGQTIGRRRGRVRFQEAVGRLLSRLRIAGMASIAKSPEPPIDM
jgi:hypothetical protein